MTQVIPGEDFTEVGSVANVFDITTMESYKIYPEITEQMLRLEPGEMAITEEFAVAYDEINLIMDGYEDHVKKEHVEFLKDLDITMPSKHGNALAIGIDPSQEDRYDQIREKLEAMYPDVEIQLDIATRMSYKDNSVSCTDTHAVQGHLCA